jgi:hypothetical protein
MYRTRLNSPRNAEDLQNLEYYKNKTDEGGKYLTWGKLCGVFRVSFWRCLENSIQNI